MDLIQAQAEELEMQTRRDLDEAQRAAERHFEEMLENKGFRVTHACEHCRQRKAKVSRIPASAQHERPMLTLAICSIW